MGPTGYFVNDIRATPDRNENKTWSPICVWATPAYIYDTMYVTFEASTAYPPPADREYLLELLSVPEDVTGAPIAGTVWHLQVPGTRTLSLPTYRTGDGLTGYQFALTFTEAAAGPGDFDNDGDIDCEDYATLASCIDGIDDTRGPGCRPQDYLNTNLNHDGAVDLADVALFTAYFTGEVAVRPAYVGVDACIECHLEVHASWTDTRHAGAFETLIADGEEENAACLPCHTVGYDGAGGFVDLATTPELAGVQCENCHGPGSLHAADAEHVGIDVNLDSAMCGQCHRSCHGMCGDYYHPHYEQWSTSKHSQALADIVLLPEFEDSCLGCHSTDYRLAPADAKPLTSEVRYSLECAGCHVPYGSEHAHQLRTAPEGLCAQCHTMGDAAPGVEPERGQHELMWGLGGFTLDGSPLDGQYMSVFAGFPGQCVYCHVYRHEYSGPDEAADAGHDFQVDLRPCLVCHVEGEAADRVLQVRNEIEPRLL
ncbi:MAG: multiheme c-type cytochrome, partial [Phycisphaerae bacterium]